jgi:DNA-binding CsgD family transcriptional regulator
LKGNYYVSPLVTHNTLELLISSSKPEGKFADRMTPRQREVLQLAAEGRSRKEIADILNISVKTVEFHKAKLMRELNLRTVADFTRYAIEHGIITADALLSRLATKVPELLRTAVGCLRKSIRLMDTCRMEPQSNHLLWHCL